ncbi:MAG: hypothetical protein HQ463_04465 [Bacteroidetes bacterium]|nr:hypothetical protein [Bacteroidota bacterium]
MQFKIFSFALIFFFFQSSFIPNSDLNIARNYYEKGSKEKSAAENLKTFTETKSTQAIFKAYNGVAYALLAKHNWNPYKKLELVTKGIEKINSAVELSQSDVEIRFLRYSIEENLPAVVPFTSHLAADKKFILANLKSTHSYYLTIKAYLKTSKTITEAEKKKL